MDGKTYHSAAREKSREHEILFVNNIFNCAVINVTCINFYTERKSWMRPWIVASVHIYGL